jgi:hypothetical protein
MSLLSLFSIQCTLFSEKKRKKKEKKKKKTIAPGSRHRVVFKGGYFPKTPEYHYVLRAIDN